MPSALSLSLLGWASYAALFVSAMHGEVPTASETTVAWILGGLFLALTFAGAVKGAICLRHRQHIISNLIAVLLLVPVIVIGVLAIRPVE